MADSAPSLHPTLTTPSPHPLLHHRAPQPAPLAPDLQASEPEEEADESCRLSVSQKLALFNNLSLPGSSSNSSSSQGPRPPAGVPPERRRQKGARYRTQPITVEEVSMVSRQNITMLWLVFVLC